MTTWALCIALLIYSLLISLPVAYAHPPDIDTLLDDTLLFVALASSVVCNSVQFISSKPRIFVRRKRRCVKNIFQELGPYHVRRAYCMKESTFWKLNRVLLPYIPNIPIRKRKRGKTTNGDISSSMKLSMAIRYFAGGSPSDLMSSHGVGFNSVYDSV